MTSISSERKEFVENTDVKGQEELWIIVYFRNTEDKEKEKERA